MEQLYFVQINSHVTPRHIEEYLHFLDESERKTYLNYRVDFKKIEFLVGRILLKTLVAAKLNISPQEIRFLTNEYGKPFLHSNHQTNNIFFNLSHSANLVACILFDHPRVGVDVELMHRNSLDVMQHAFLPEEIAFVNAHETSRDQLNAFYLVWTRKEAVMKAHGSGFSLNPQSFSVPTVWGDTEDTNYFYYSTEILEDYCCSIAVGRIPDIHRPKWNLQQMSLDKLLTQVSL